jgi:hypothetical protein
MNHFEAPVPSKTVSYGIHFSDGSKLDSFTLEGAMRLIALRYRVKRVELITDTTEEKISVWMYPDTPIAEVFIPRVMVARKR